jgi:N6-adenosine-specific RNA methylase IME4
MGKYRTIYADPPWPESGGGKLHRGANRHYSLMTVSQIRQLSTMIEGLTEPDAHLYLWVTNNFLPAGLDVMKTWGFRYVTKITWVKDANFGIGQYYRGRTEECLFGVKGTLPYKIVNGKRRQGETVIFTRPGEHSEKPERMRVSYGPYIELFARRKYPGWDVWGLEAPEKDITEGKLI